LVEASKQASKQAFRKYQRLRRPNQLVALIAPDGCDRSPAHPSSQHALAPTLDVPLSCSWTISLSITQTQPKRKQLQFLFSRDSCCSAPWFHCGRFGGASVPYSRYRINRRVLLSSALHKSLLFKHAAQKEPPCTTQELSQARIETKALNGIELAPVSNEN
jgi:hypothetical protein